MPSPDIGGPIKPIVMVSTDSTSQGFRLIDGCQYVVSKDYFVGVAEGDLPHHSGFWRIGWNSAVGTVEEDVWYGGTYVYPPSSAHIVVARSETTNDGPGGTGIQTALVTYLDNNYIERTTTVTLNGTEIDLVATDIYRVNSLKALTVGSGGVAAGLVSLHASSAASPIYRAISSGYTRARSAFYTVPAGITLYVTDVTAGVGANQKTAARLTLRANYDPIIGSTLSFFFPFWEQTIVDQGYTQHFPVPIMFPEKTDVKISCYTNQSSGVIIQAAMRGWEES